MIVAVDADTSDEKDDEACKSKNVVEMAEIQLRTHTSDLGSQLYHRPIIPITQIRLVLSSRARLELETEC